MTNARFSEYATSGAFALSLSRNQVATLGIIASGGDGFGSSVASLERKGLVETVANPCDLAGSMDRVELRATSAGLLCAALLQEAGLTNGPADPMAAELAAMRAELEERRIEAATARRNARSAIARLQEVEGELAVAVSDLKTLRAGIQLKPEFAALRMPTIRWRDPTPERSTADLLAAVQEPAE